MRRRRRHAVQTVELNLAAMLDMAFQLLAFFILTYQTSPVEGQIDLRLPPLATSVPVPSPGGDVGQPASALVGLTTLDVELQAGVGGELGGILLAGRPVDDLGRLERKLARTLADPTMPFQRVALHVGPRLRYEALMQVIDVCGRLRVASGQKLAELSLREIPE